MSRLQELMRSMPPTTLLLTGTCVVLYVAQLVTEFNLGYVAINPYFVIYQWEWWRIVTSAVFHLGILHIVMNMMSFQALGVNLEHTFGSLVLLYLIVLIMLLSGVLYVGACWVIAMVTRDVRWLLYQSVGFSGVLFGLAVQESFLSSTPTRSVFGLFNVPTQLYPWALLIILQVLMPNVSFVGHLSGLLVGFAHVRGWLWWCIPTAATFQKWEDSAWCIRLVNAQAFVRTPSTCPVAGRVREGPGFCAALGGWLRCACAPIINVVSAITAPVKGALMQLRNRLRPYSPLPTHDGEGVQMRSWGGGVLGSAEAEVDDTPAVSSRV